MRRTAGAAIATAEAWAEGARAAWRGFWEWSERSWAFSAAVACGFAYAAARGMGGTESLLSMALGSREAAVAVWAAGGGWEAHEALRRWRGRRRPDAAPGRAPGATR